MAIQDAEYKCSCGHSTTWLLHAIDHVNSTGHTMSVSGAIKPGVSRTSCPPLHSPTSQNVITKDFDNLRNKLNEAKGVSDA